MGWAALIPIIAQYGLAVGERLWQLWNSKNEPSQADWDQLNTLAAQTSRMRMVDALARAGIPVDDPKAQALLALVKPA